MYDELDARAFRSFENYWAIALRRRWWILLSMFLAWAAVWGGSWLLPSAYKSEALILVELQNVPHPSVVPSVTTNPRERVQAMTEQILSRTQLQATIDHFQLYSPHRGLNGLLKSGDPVSQMRHDIKIDFVEPPGRPGGIVAFKIAYSAESPELARDVDSELTTLFIDEDARVHQRLSEATTSSLENDLAEARKNMEEQEAKVATFEARHMGDLPSQLTSNVQTLSSLQSQLQNTQQALDAARQQKHYLQSLPQQYQSVQAGKSNSSDGLSAETRVQVLEKELREERVRLNNLKSRYTDDFPDVLALTGTIAQTEQVKKQAEDAMAANQEAPQTPSTNDPATVGESRGGSAVPMMQVQSQLRANELEILNDEQHKKYLEARIAQYQTRLNLTPTTEQELKDISRGYEESKANYNSLLQKEMQSKLAWSLEDRQQAEQFRIVDPASLPTKPSAPNHLLFSLAGLLAGLALGLGLTSLIELVDGRIRQEKDLQGIVSARVLVGIPRLNTEKDNIFRALRWWTELGAAITLIALIVLGNFYSFYKG
jgi:succinoglycan biosynthesis transport protein ExoP